MSGTSTTEKHYLQEPESGLLYRALPDGTHGLTPSPRKAVAFHTSAPAVEYATERLAGRAAELVRVAG